MLKFKTSFQRFIWLVMITTAGIMGLSLWMVLRQQIANSDVAKATTLPSNSIQSNASSRSVTALGRLQPEGEDLIQVATPSSTQMSGQSVIQELRVKEGSKVSQGDVLAILDNQGSLSASLVEAQASWENAIAQLEQVKAGAKLGEVEAARANVARIEAELRIVRRDYQRHTQLQKEGAISVAELDARWMILKTTEQQLEQARQTLNSIKEVRPTDVRQAQAQVAIAQATLQRAKLDLDRSYVRAPISGQVIQIHTLPGEKVGDKGILELGNTDTMYVVAEVYETDIRLVKVGQQAIITSPVFEGEVTGQVERIGLTIKRNEVFNTDPQADTDTRIVEVKIRLNESNRVARFTNLQVYVTIRQ